MKVTFDRRYGDRRGQVNKGRPPRLNKYPRMTLRILTVGHQLCISTGERNDLRSE